MRGIDVGAESDSWIRSWWVLPTVSCLSLLLTGAMRRYALARSLMDIPNARSSHRVPTPRGGGVAIVLSFLPALAVLWAHGALGTQTLWALLGAGAWVAAVGFADDHGDIAAERRLLAHFLGAIWALAWLGGAPALTLFGSTVDLGWTGAVLATLYLVWLVNLYNFMDGIDGLAAVEAICVCTGGAFLYALVGQPSLALVPLALAGAAAGFLYWNFPPAKIFMGDAGSGFLGLVLGVLSLQAASVASELFWGWLILLGVFIVEATWTLLRRLLRGDRVYEAHCSHAYQYASRRLGHHRPVALSVAVITLFWLLPLALWVGLSGLDGLIGLAVAYLPLGVLAVWLRAGALEGRVV